MKNLIPIPNYSLHKWYIDIVSNKEEGDTKVYLQNISTDIKIRFKEYSDKFSKDELINISNSSYSKNNSNLLSCYKSEGVILKKLKKKIKDKQNNDLKGICQYCGILRPKTMDHYLPISEFPEFSVLGLNLIPCCKDCNGKKKSHWKRLDNTGRGIINLYVDTIPNVQFLTAECKLIKNQPVLKFKLENPNISRDIEFFKILKDHYHQLSLIELYEEEASDEIGELTRTIINYDGDIDRNEISIRLLKDGDELFHKYGKNYWRGVIRVTLAKSNIYLNYVIGEINNF